MSQQQKHQQKILEEIRDLVTDSVVILRSAISSPSLMRSVQVVYESVIVKLDEYVNEGDGMGKRNYIQRRLEKLAKGEEW